jgi:hypothetical protein
MSVERSAETVAAHDAATVAAYLRTVHASAIAAGVPGRIAVSERMPPGSKARYVSHSWPLDEIERAASACVRISSRTANAFVRVHLLDRVIDKTERGKEIDTRYVTHFAADVDVAGPGHLVDNLPETLDEALGIVDAALAPSLVVSSGGGIYPHLVLDPVVEIDSDEKRKHVKEIGRRFDAALKAHGRHVDSTCGDLARIVRPPGVTNHKRDRSPLPVTILRGTFAGAGTYTLEQLDEVLPPLPAPAPSKRRQRAASTTSESSTRDNDGDTPWSIFDARYSLADVLGADPRWQWEHVGEIKGDEAWRRAGSSSDYSLRRHPTTGAVVIWSSVVAERLGVEPGEALDLYGLALRLAGRDVATAGKTRGAAA